MRNIFLENHEKNMVEKLVLDPFLKKSKLSLSLDLESEVSHSLFLLYIQVEDFRNILKLAFTSYKAFFKKRKRCLELVSLPHFLHDV